MPLPIGSEGTGPKPAFGASKNFRVVDKDGLRVNNQIRVPEVTVIDEKGENLGVMRASEAVAQANSRGLDLVEVSPQAKPPVCKYMDYGKFKYRKNKKAHEAKRHQKIIKVKEVKLTPRTSEHDYQFKLVHIMRFLGEGNKAKVTVFFKGRQIDHAELGRVMLDRYVKDTEEFAFVTQMPKLEGRTMSILLEPKPMKAKPAAPKTAAPKTPKTAAGAGAAKVEEKPVQVKEGEVSAENKD